MALWFWGVHMFLAWWLLFILTVLHVVADLYHRIIKRDSLNLGHILPGP
jgi:cytochrome b561